MTLQDFSLVNGIYEHGRFGTVAIQPRAPVKLLLSRARRILPRGHLEVGGRRTILASTQLTYIEVASSTIVNLLLACCLFLLSI